MAVHGIDQRDIDKPIGPILHEQGRPLPAEVPPTWTVRRVIERGVQEARHGAQEVLDETAHADGWPR